MYDFSENYKELIHSCENEISILSNSSAFFQMMLEDISWVGFYLYENKELILGPFQGKVACTNIQIGKGVCGTCAKTKEIYIVDDVHQFSGHIACDANSNSEIVIPIIIDDNLYGVLDIDSTSFKRFTQDDAKILNKCVSILIQTLKKRRT